MFAVDEMAIMQGGLPIMFLTLQNLWGNMPVGVVSTGAAAQALLYWTPFPPRPEFGRDGVHASLKRH